MAQQQISARLQPAVVSHPFASQIQVGLVSAAFGVVTGAVANASPPAQYLAATLAPTTTLTPPSIRQRMAAPATLSPAPVFAINSLSAKYLSATFAPTTQFNANISWQLKNIRAGLNPAPQLGAMLSQVVHLLQIARLAPTSSLRAAMYTPRPAAARLSGNVGLVANAFVAQIMPPLSAVMSAETELTADTTWVKFTWPRYGSDLLYQEAAPYEKSVIDVEAPRLVGIYAEIIIDTWDPYNCPIALLPYLAWAMGVTFWNDHWSEQTKRDWIAVQWLFKSLRGTDGAQYMAVDYAGRDVSPFGYKVNKIITAPQGQYPSPGVTHDQQEAWLASLPQVRVYNFQDPGLALPYEFYASASYITP